MTKKETQQILAILKAAYPNSYKNMTRQEANGTVSVWHLQFSKIPAEVVMIAINKLIAKSTFPPAISEVKDAIRSLYWEIWGDLLENKYHHTLTPSQVDTYNRLLDVVEPIHGENASVPSLKEITGGTFHNLLGGDVNE
jgi:hypothetical protein